MQEQLKQHDTIQEIKTKYPRIMFAAPKSGSGKTLVTCAFLEALKERGMGCRAFKCGPDYIDPMFHERVIGVPSRNLDLFFAEEGEVRSLFLEEDTHFNPWMEGNFDIFQTTKGEKLRVIEGVMGLYDGVSGIREEASSYHLAVCLQTPIVLVVDAKGMGRSLLALLAGYLQYDRERLIKGVVLNKVSRSFLERVKPLIEHELGIAVLGCFPELSECRLESRHLGLVLPGELKDLEQKVQRAAQVLTEHVDMGKILEIARNAPYIQSKNKCICKAESKSGLEAAFIEEHRNRKEVQIGIALDEAFCFYYQDNLRLLQEAGAKLVPFSPLRDVRLPNGIQGILLGGGYPEIWAENLSANEEMRAAIRTAIQGGMPSIAECGGFMYLHRAIVSREDEGARSFPMCGVLPGDCYGTGKLVRFGYVTLSARAEKRSFLAEGEQIRGHEFHYYDSLDNGADCRAVKPGGKLAWECVHASESHWWGFAHLYYLSNPRFVERFIMSARNHKI